MRYITYVIFIFLIGNAANAQMNGSFIDPRDGKIYKWVRIGNQTWMAENLAYKSDSGDCYIFDNNESNLMLYGYLYNWETANKVCPEGWHLPEFKDFKELISFVGPDPGIKLKAKTGWQRDGNGTDEFKFSALPGGRYAPDGFLQIEYLGYWWSATELPRGLGVKQAGMLYISCALDYVQTIAMPANVALSVRCIKDK